MQLQDLSDDELLACTEAICKESRRVLARLIVHLIEIEERRLYERRACPSMFEFCRLRLGMSQPAAHRRTVAARIVRRFPFPSVLDAIERGAIHLSSLVLLRDVLNERNVETLVAEASGK